MTIEDGEWRTQWPGRLCLAAGLTARLSLEHDSRVPGHDHSPVGAWKIRISRGESRAWSRDDFKNSGGLFAAEGNFLLRRAAVAVADVHA